MVTFRVKEFKSSEKYGGYREGCIENEGVYAMTKNAIEQQPMKERRDQQYEIGNTTRTIQGNVLASGYAADWRVAYYSTLINYDSDPELENVLVVANGASDMSPEKLQELAQTSSGTTLEAKISEPTCLDLFISQEFLDTYSIDYVVFANEAPKKANPAIAPTVPGGFL